MICLALMPAALRGQVVSPRPRTVVKALGECVPDTIRLRGSAQGMAIRDGRIWLLRDGGQCVVLNLRNQQFIGSFQLPENNSHCNNASWGADGLMLVSWCRGTKQCDAVCASDWGAAVKQRFFFDSKRFPVAHDWCCDAESQALYIYGGRWGETLYLCRLPYPDDDRDTVRFTDKDIVGETAIDCVSIAQGSLVWKGMAFLLDGDESANSSLHIVNLNTGSEIQTISLSSIGQEPEGLAIAGRWLYVNFNTQDPKESKIVRFKIKGRN